MILNFLMIKKLFTEENKKNKNIKKQKIIIWRKRKVMGGRFRKKNEWMYSIYSQNNEEKYKKKKQN